MPQPVLRMHQDAERRRPQPFGAHRPLLERQIRAVGRRNGARPEFFGHRADDMSAPAVERIFEAVRLPLAPVAGNAAMARCPAWPTSSTDFAGLPEGPGGAASLVAECKAAAQDEAMRRQRGSQIVRVQGVSGLRLSARMRPPMSDEADAGDPFDPVACVAEGTDDRRRRHEQADDRVPGERAGDDERRPSAPSASPAFRRVTDVAKTLANSTIALGLVSVTRSPNSSELPGRDARADSSTAAGLASSSLMPR